MEHTQGEWKVSTVDDDLQIVVLDDIADENVPICTMNHEWLQLRANAARIVHCVNNFDDIVEALRCALVDSELRLTLADRKQRAKYYQQAIAKAEAN